MRELSNLKRIVLCQTKFSQNAEYMFPQLILQFWDTNIHIQTQEGMFHHNSSMVPSVFPMADGLVTSVFPTADSLVPRVFPTADSLVPRVLSGW